MNKIIGLGILAFSFFLFTCNNNKNTRLEKPGQVPMEEYFMQKHGIPSEAFLTHKFNEIQSIKEQKFVFRNPNITIEGDWTVQGPGNIGARINTIAVHPTNENYILIGFSHGGIFLTSDGGQNWSSVFDKEVSLAIGDIVFDPINPKIVYAGTGDANGGYYTGQGNGVYKSTDGGQSWTYKGLAETRIISEIMVDPSNTNIVYVGAIGYSYERNNNRGLYKSTDGGNTWDNILFISDSTAVTDIDMDPSNPNIIYAATFDKLGSNIKGLVQGLGNGIYKSTDKGAFWVKLKNGLPDTVNGRIAIAVSKSDPNILYARYIGPNATCGDGQHFNGFYKSTNKGDSWTKIATTGLDCNTMGGFGWYFSKIIVNPKNSNDILMPAVRLLRSTNGGLNWNRIDRSRNDVSVHADKHDAYFNKDSTFLLATDGGLYKYFTDTIWSDMENIPTTQFYRVAYNPTASDLYFGGTQDNGSTGGNASNITDWPRIYGGDGFEMAFHPTNKDIFFVEYQYGEIRMTKNGGFDFVNLIQNLPGSKNWDCPFDISIHNANKIIAGAEAVYVCNYTDPTFPWKRLSPILITKGPYINRSSSNLTTLHESILDSTILIAGTSNGNVWLTDNYDTNWVNVTSGLPPGFISCVKTSPTYRNTVYVTVSAHRNSNYDPYVFISNNLGTSYRSIAGDLPKLPVYDILIYPERKDSVIFVANEIGVYATIDAGTHWERVGDNMPFIQVYELEFNPSTQEIIAGTYARGIQTFPLKNILDKKIVTIHNYFSELELIMYPMPVSDFAMIGLKGDRTFDEAKPLNILDINGRKILSMKKSKGNMQYLNVSNLSPGSYYLEYFINQKRKIYSFVKL